MDRNDRNKIIGHIVAVAAAFITTIAMAQVSHYGITGIELLMPCVFALCLVVFYKAADVYKRHTDVVRRDMKFTLPLGIIASLSTVFGSKIDLDTRIFGAVRIMDMAYIIMLVPFFAAVFGLLFFSSDALTISTGESGVVSESKGHPVLRGLGINMAVLMLCWLPYYLTYYPGGIGNDIFESVNMCLGTIPLTNHHPVFFTGIIKLFISIFGSDITTALGMMVFCQMLIMAFTVSLIIQWLKYNGFKRVIRMVSLAFFALHPIVALYSVYLTKDVIFSCIVVILVLFLIDYCRYAIKGKTEKKIDIKYHMILTILLLATMITRNNGTVVVILSAAAAIIAIKNMRKYLIISLIVAMLIMGIYKGPVWNALGVEKQSFAESAAIPLTQIAYTIYTDGAIEGEDRAYLEELMPFDAVKKSFAPGYVDTYKFDSEFNTKLLDSDPGRFMKTWLHLLIPNFGKYVEGYLFETCGYWSYGVSNTVATEGVKENNLGIEEKDYIKEMAGVSLRGILEKLVLVARKLPLLCMLSQMAIQILAVALLSWQFIRRKKAYLTVALGPLWALWISVMIASPAYCLFRYMFPVFLLWPVMLAVFFRREQEGK